MATPDLAHLPGAREGLPTIIKLDPNGDMPPHSARELDLIEEMTGTPLAEMSLSGKASDSITMMVWLNLRRQGYDPTWDEARDVLVEYVTPTPTESGSSESSPHSAITTE